MAAKSGRGRVHLIGNAHIDPVWLWRWQEGYAETHATFRSALDRMAETPDYVFTCSSAALYEWIEEGDPPMFARIQARVREGRWAVVGGWWIEPDCNLPCGEALVRQGLYAQRYFRARFGAPCRVGYCVDSFGHAGTLPKLLAGCGMHAYVCMRPQAHENAAIPPLAFTWQGDDGTRVAVLRIPDGYGVWQPEALQGQLASSLEQARGTPLGDEVFAFYGVGNHGGGPTRELLQQIRRWQAQGDMPELVHSSPQAFLGAIRDRRLPVWRGEMQHHARGCYAAVSAIKAANRRAEEALIGAEMWNAAARLAVGRRPDTAELGRAWKHLLFNQFHDILAGSSVGEAYVDALQQLGAATHAAQTSANAARQAIARKVDTQGEGAPLLVFNNQPFPFSGVVETEDVGFLVTPPADGEAGLLDAEGAPLPCQAIAPHTICGRRRFVVRVRLPALGYAVLRQGAVGSGAARRSLGPSAVCAGRLSLRNDRLRLGLNAEGYLLLQDLRLRRQVLARGGLVPLVCEDHSDTWSHGVAAYPKVIGRFARVEAQVVERGPVRGSLRVRYAWGDSLLALEFLLGAGEGFVTVRGRVNWRQQWQVLKLAMPVTFRADSWTAEAPYGLAVRPTSGEEEPVQQWVDLSRGGRGLAVANDGRYSCSVEPSEVRLTVLRSPPYAFHDPFRPEDFAHHDFTEQGEQAFNLLLAPHGGDWRQAGVLELARQLNRPPSTLCETFHAGPLGPTGGFLQQSAGKGVYVTALKEAEDGGGLVVRLVEWFGRRRRARLLLPALGREWTGSLRPHEVQSLFVPYARRTALRVVDLLEE
ncbi:MAG: glycoside hydrolase family 38 C-terminal domain-containing protein [Candidatus Latescibacterota bacterium]